jgi:ABC-type dipeptide/oligopeptide/nickel transport system permease subunit
LDPSTLAELVWFSMFLAIHQIDLHTFAAILVAVFVLLFLSVYTLPQSWKGQQEYIVLPGATRNQVDLLAKCTLGVRVSLAVAVIVCLTG